MAAYEGKSIEDARSRRSYQIAERFVNDILNETTPGQTNQENQNDQIAFIMEKLSDIFELFDITTAQIPAIQLFQQYIDEDITIPAGYDAVTAARGVLEPNTVKITTGSILHMLGCEANSTSVVAKNKTNIIDGADSDYAIDIDMAGSAVRHTGGAITVTIPLVADEGWEVGDTIIFYNEGAGNISFVKGDVSVVFPNSKNMLPDNGSCGAIVMTAIDNWVFVGAFV